MSSQERPGLGHMGRAEKRVARTDSTWLDASKAGFPAFQYHHPVIFKQTARTLLPKEWLL